MATHQLLDFAALKSVSLVVMSEDQNGFSPDNHEYPARTQSRAVNSNCLKTAGITCLVVLVIMIAVGAWIIHTMSRNETIRTAFSGARLVAECQTNLRDPAPGAHQDVSRAIDRYVRRHGKYPNSLDELYPTFLEDRTCLHCPADASDKDTISYEYTQPAMDAPGDTVIVECRRHVLVQGQPPLVLQLLKDGRVLRQGYIPRGERTEPVEVD